MPNLIVNFKNMCVFAPETDRTEVWFPANDFHRPFLNVDKVTIPESLHGVITSAGLPLKDRLVRFVDNGAVLPAGPTEFVSKATFKEILPPFEDLLGVTDFKQELQTMTADSIAPQLFTKVVVTGGKLEAFPLNTVGGQKKWTISETAATKFCQDVTYTVPVTSNKVAVRVAPRIGNAQPLDLPISPAPSGDFIVGISSENLNNETMMEMHQAVVFLLEFNLFQPIIDAPRLTAPFTFWSDFDLVTDPNGGPCMMMLSKRI